MAVLRRQPTVEVTIRLATPAGNPQLEGRLGALVADRGHFRRDLMALLSTASTSDGSLARITARRLK
jgi:hypothetical protein